MEDEKSKTHNLFIISQNLQDLKERFKDSDDRLRDVEKISNENQFNHKNTHEKLDNILNLCGKTDSRIRVLEDTTLEHKTKIKTIGTIAGLVGGGISLALKLVFDAWNKH